MQRKVVRIVQILVLVGLIQAGGSYAGTKTWNGGVAGDWSVAGNWDPSGIPQAGDDVVISSAGVSVSLANASPSSGWLGSLDINNTASLVFSNWNTTLSVTNLTIGANASLTCAGPFADTGMSNRVAVVCSNLTIAANGKIDVDGKGFVAGSGPGKGLASKEGGGHGGQGQTSAGGWGGAPYGSVTAPTDPGSGGYTTGGSAGGGAVLIDADGHVIVNGSITADGVDNVAAPGAGGSVYITCATFGGTNGTIDAEGGDPGYSSSNGGGGGGRIAVRYNEAAQAGLPIPQVTFSALAGRRLNANVEHRFRGDIGTLWFPDTAWLTNTIPHSGRLVIPGFTSWSTPDLTVNGWIRFPGEGFDLTVDGNLVVNGQHARFDMGSDQWTNRYIFNNYCNPTNGPTLTVGGDLSLAGGGHFSIHSGSTNGSSTDYGALVSVTGTVTIGAYSWILPISHPTDGGSVLFRAANVMVAANGGVNANGYGWPGGYGGDGYGPGAGIGSAAGGGYGGLGQAGNGTDSGAIYGASDAPVQPGSGGWGNTGTKGGNAGGAVRIEASGTVTINGTVKADAIWYGFNTTSTGGGAAGASGGSIYITCGTVAGSGGALTAKGGSSSSSNHGVGGGGRIALWYETDTTGGGASTDAAGGTSPNRAGQVGTVVWDQSGAWDGIRRWTGGSGNGWGTAGNWTPAGVPQAGDDVVIDEAGVTVLLSSPAPASGRFSSLTLGSTATLIFTNWTTAVNATNISLEDAATMSCAGPFTSDAAASNRIHLVCDNLFVDDGADIDADGRGFTAGHGPGHGTASGQGGGYGGQGQTSTAKPGGGPYGSAEQPMDPGSGGYQTSGSAGGGAVRIEVQDHVIINGSITADGGDNVAAPGSGGAVYITCTTFAATGGVIRADGGSPINSSGNGGGGGGRVAIHYNEGAQSGLPVPDVILSANAGERNNAEHPFRGDLGTLYLPDATWLTATIPHNGRLVIPGFTSWAPASLTVNGWVRFPAEAFGLTVTGDAFVDGAHARLDLGSEQWANRVAFNTYCNPTNGPTLSVGGDLVLTNGGHLSIHSGVTNGAAPDYGALVSVAGAIDIGANSWILPFSHPSDGGSVLFRADAMAIAAGAGFNAGGRGWAGGSGGNGYGTGAGSGTTAGAGHGGLGRDGANNPSGAIYGTAGAPIAPGSGGSSTTRGGNGGGSVRLEIANAVTLDGTINADAMSDGSILAAVGGSSAGGSGGTIYLTCKTIDGAGALSAAGGGSTSSSSGAGGGGRIAVWFKTDHTAGTVSTNVANGASPTATAEPGTVVWSIIPSMGTLVTVR